VAGKSLSRYSPRRRIGRMRRCMRRVCQRNESSVLPAADAHDQHTGSRMLPCDCAHRCASVCAGCAVRVSACCEQGCTGQRTCASAPHASCCPSRPLQPPTLQHVLQCVAMRCNMFRHVQRHALPVPVGLFGQTRLGAALVPIRAQWHNPTRTRKQPRYTVAHRRTRAGSEQQRTTAVVQRSRSIVRTAPDRRTLSMKSSPSSPSPRCPKHETCAHHKQRAWIRWIQHPVRIMPSQLQQYA
jgi:hypothetical protein